MSVLEEASFGLAQKQPYCVECTGSLLRQRPYRVECTGSLPSFSLPWYYVRFGRVRLCTLGTRVSALPSEKDLSGGERLPSRPSPRGPRACAPLACASHRSFLCVGGTTPDDCNLGQNLFEGRSFFCARPPLES